MIRHLALLFFAAPALAAAQQADSSARVPSTGAAYAAPVTTAEASSSAASGAPGAPSPAYGAAPSVAGAPDSVFLRAQRLVAAGQGDTGRSIVQAELDAAPVGSPGYVKALYWRAVVAATAADAERDLQRIVIEYPLAPQSADALLRLAQLEMARGERRQALVHLDRLVLEHPNDPSRARASFWMARALFDENDAPGACARLRDATRSVALHDVELKNQIDYYQQRCVGMNASVAAATPAVPTRAAGLGPMAPAQGAAVRPPAGPSAVPPRASAPGAVPTAAAPPMVPAVGDAPAAPAGRSRSGPAAVTMPAAPAATMPAPPPAAESGMRYAVQVAAYSNKEAAERLRASLEERGYDAHVVEGKRLYRVRVGRYTTRAEAEAAEQRMASIGMKGFVAEEEVQ